MITDKTGRLEGRVWWLPIDGVWQRVSDWDIDNSPDPDAFRRIIAEYEDNRIRHFLPHGGATAFLGDLESDIAMLVAPNQVGKALPLWVRVIMAGGGTKAMGDLEVGDRVVGKDGQPATVTHIFPQGMRATYTLDLDGQIQVEADGDHLWEYIPWNRTVRNGGTAEPEVVTTKAIYKIQQGGGVSTMLRGEIPLCKPVEFDTSGRPELPDRPYLIGAAVVRGGVDGEQYGATVGGIPKAYLYRSASERTDLLRGIMDSVGRAEDGWVWLDTEEEGFCGIVAWLVRSLGGIARTVKHGWLWTVQITMRGINPFMLNEQAAAEWEAKRFPDGIWVGGELPVNSVRRTGRSEECVCITVDNADGTFLLDDFIVTHNSYAGTAFSILRTIPCDPKWEVFTKHGVKFVPWTGPKTWLVASLSWETVEVLWDHYRTLLPREMLGRYADDWGEREGDFGRKLQQPSFTGGRPKRITLTCGTTYVFGCYTQPQGQWEAKRFDGAQLDEQIPHEKFIGYLRGTVTREKAQCCMTLTGHVVHGRPDTGAAGWVKRDLWDGRDLHGKRVGKFRIQIPDVPDAIISSQRKAELKQQWVTTPEANADVRALREAKARYWGDWEPGSGLVMDNFEQETHIIPKIEGFRKMRQFIDATKYRGMDHGTTRPTTCLLGAVFPWGDLVLYDEYYVPNQSTPHHVKEILKMCGSGRKEVARIEDETSGASWPVFEEVYGDEKYFASVLDGRSFGNRSPERGCLVGQLYNDLGLYCSRASTAHNKDMVPRMKQWFEIDPHRVHVMKKFFDAGMITKPVYEAWLTIRNGNFMGGSRCYIMAHLRHMIDEIMSWAYKPTKDGSLTDEPQKENDHLIGAAFKYMIAEEPSYMGQYWKDDNEIDADDEAFASNKFTGY